MENINLKNKKTKGRPPYQPDLKQLKQLFLQVVKKKITNEEAWKIANCGKTKWYALKKLYNK